MTNHSNNYFNEVNLDVGNKHFLIYTKLSRFDPIKDAERLKFLFKNRKISLDKVLVFVPQLEKEIIQKRIDFLMRSEKSKDS